MMIPSSEIFTVGDVKSVDVDDKTDLTNVDHGIKRNISKRN